MTVPLHSRLISTLGLVPVAASLIALLLAGLSLTGWLFDLTSVRSVFSGWPSMVPNTALGLIVAAGSLWLLRDAQPRKQWMQRLAQLGAALLVLFALLTLSEYLFGWDLGLDRWLFEGQLRAGGQPF